jgi:hypothetical protein
MAWLRAFSVITSGNGYVRRARRSAGGWVSLVLAPVMAVGAGTALVPVAVVAAGAAAVTAAGVAEGSAPAKAATGTALILSTSVNGRTSSAEATAVRAGYTVATPATWDGMTTAQFRAFSLLIIGDPSSGTCSSTVPSDALSTAGRGVSR